MAHVWVLETFTREDSWCNYDSEVVAVYSKSNYQKARKHFTELCSDYEDENYDIERWHDEDGYHFTATEENYQGCNFNYVGLKKMEVM